jgi:hypothetical protein
MFFRSFTFAGINALALTSLIFLFLNVVGAEVRSSPSYQLQSDSINFAGGLSSSSNYLLESTAGEVATGDSESTSYKLRAGYQQMQEVFISMTAPDPVVMTPNILGITGGTANGSTSVSVLTDSSGGYELTISAESAPAMQKGGDTIADYVPVANPDPDFSFLTSPTTAHFGFSPEGPDIDNRFRDDGLLCNASTGDTALACWDGLGTSNKVIARGAANQPNGATTTLNFRLVVGGSIVVPAGDYFATTTLTALPL